jgi:hypothetical protein
MDLVGYPQADKRVGKSKINGTPKRPMTAMDAAYGPSYVNGKPLAPLAPGRLDQLQADADAENVALNNRVEGDRNQLGFTGAVINDGLVSGLNRQSALMAERNASSGRMLDHLNGGGGLQYRSASAGFGTPEQGSQAANDFRSMAAVDATRRAEADAAYNAKFDQYRKMDRDVSSKPMVDRDGDGIPDAGVDETFGKYGVRNISDLQKMNAKYYAYQRGFKSDPNAKGTRLMSFDEFVKANHDEYKALPAYGAPAPSAAGAAQSPQSASTLQSVIDLGNKVARDGRTGPSEFRVSQAQDQARMVSDAAFARAHGLDPRAAVVARARENQANRFLQANQIAEMERLNAEIGGRNSIADLQAKAAADMAKARGESELAVANARSASELAVAKQQGADNLSVANVKQKALDAQAAEDRKVKTIGLVNAATEGMKPLGAVFQESVERNLAAIKSNPQMVRQYPTPEAQAEAAKQMSLPAIRSMAEENKIRLAQLAGYGVDVSAYSPYTAMPDVSAVAVSPVANVPVEVQGPASASEVVKEYQQSRLNPGMSVDPRGASDILANSGRYIDSNTIQDLIRVATSKGEGWEDAEKVLVDLFERSPNDWSWTDQNVLASMPWANAPADWENPELIKHLASGGTNFDYTGPRLKSVKERFDDWIAPQSFPEIRMLKDPSKIDYRNLPKW